MAIVFEQQGQYSKALELYERALAGREKALGADHPITFAMMHNMAIVFELQGQYNKALELDERTLAREEKALLCLSDTLPFTRSKIGSPTMRGSCEHIWVVFTQCLISPSPCSLIKIQPLLYYPCCSNTIAMLCHSKSIWVVHLMPFHPKPMLAHETLVPAYIALDEEIPPPFVDRSKSDLGALCPATSSSKYKLTHLCQPS
ncbi:Tetratricopeptide repeat-domain-containing protein [Kalaharituber pfeilii]|nr:Tetratricopeptide repeat-domain-containing protein [Kalaharituber pfeilii]